MPVAYLLFAGEQHGFRKAENIKRALDGELYFYAIQVFGCGSADSPKRAPGTRNLRLTSDRSVIARSVGDEAIQMPHPPYWIASPSAGNDDLTTA